MSEPELHRAVETCVATLAQRGRPHLAERVRAQVERLLSEGRTSQALAVLGLFAPRTP